MATKTERAARAAEFERLYERAAEAGCAAGAANPATPVAWVGVDIVGTPTGERFTAAISGTAYIKIRPANHPFVKWMTAQGIRGFKAYGGGWQMAVRRYGQEFEPAMAYANAFAEVLREAGIQAYTDSWVT